VRRYNLVKQQIAIYSRESQLGTLEQEQKDIQE
jgi:hypothetical protein